MRQAEKPVPGRIARGLTALLAAVLFLFAASSAMAHPGHGSGHGEGRHAAPTVADHDLPDQVVPASAGAGIVAHTDAEPVFKAAGTGIHSATVAQTRFTDGCLDCQTCPFHCHAAGALLTVGLQLPERSWIALDTPDRTPLLRGRSPAPGQRPPLTIA